MKFDIKMTIDIDEEDNILPISEDMYEQTVKELIQDVVYDIDAEIKQIEVKQNHEQLLTDRLPIIYSQVTLR